MSGEGLVRLLDDAAVLVFALTGALAASRRQLDLVGFIFLATLTAVGGGTTRDLVLGRTPVFWIIRPEPLVLAAAAAVSVFWTAHRLESRAAAIVWLDALALAAAVPAGAGVALDLGHGPVTILVAGVMTGCLGGLMRDVVSNELPLILHKGELYATAAFGGATTILLALALDAPRDAALLAGGAAVFVLRAGSLTRGWRLPVYRPRPPRRR